jgi:phosphatidylserine/phosphatidylglycerophosphate/cardiolipin synthase-like enzyme
VEGMSKEPRYWGSWKGRVIRAIAIDRAQTWAEIRDLTGLSPKSLNRVLAEMFDAEVLEKDREGEYWVTKELYREYVDFFAEQEAEVKSAPVRISEDEQKDLVSRIDEWREFKGLDFSLKPEHFFLEGNNLYGLSIDLIQKAKKEVLVANPFVDQCDLSDKLREVASPDKDVILVTRRPDDKSEEYRKRKEEYHQTLKKSGVKVAYNKRVHAKLIVLDRSVAIISSMNLNSSSTGGSSWEAGIVTKEDSVVEVVSDSILNLREKLDSEKE